MWLVTRKHSGLGNILSCPDRYVDIMLTLTFIFIGSTPHPVANKGLIAWEIARKLFHVVLVVTKICILGGEAKIYSSRNPTWIIPVSKCLITLVDKSPKDRVVGPLPNGRTSWLINGGDPITTYDTWEPILQVSPRPAILIKKSAGCSCSLCSLEFLWSDQ